MGPSALLLKDAERNVLRLSSVSTAEKSERKESHLRSLTEHCVNGESRNGIDSYLMAFRRHVARL